MDFIRPTGDRLHLATGALLARVGFGRSSAKKTRVAVSVVGSLFPCFGTLNPFTAPLDDLPVGSYENGEDLAHVVLGLLNVFAAIMLPREDGPYVGERNPANTL